MKEWIIEHREKLLNTWRSIYVVAIPSFVTFTYIIIIFLIKLNKIDWRILTETENLNEMLNAIITFVSIVIGVFGFLLPILIVNKKECGIVEYFFTKTDPNKFSKNLKKVIMSGFLVILNSIIMFMNDIISDFAFTVICCLFVWLLLYFMCNSYRFISILLLLFMTEKKQYFKDEINTISQEKIEELNTIIKKK